MRINNSRYFKVASIILRSSHFYKLYILGLLLFYCILFYYFGEIILLLGCDSIRYDIFFGPHDIQRFCYLIPIVFAGSTFGSRGAIITTLVSMATILPHFIDTRSSPLSSCTASKHPGGKGRFETDGGFFPWVVHSPSTPSVLSPWLSANLSGSPNFWKRRQRALAIP